MTNNIKQIIIDAPEGKIIDLEHFNQTGNVKFIDEIPTKVEFPKEWELKGGINYFININSTIKDLEIDDNYTKLNGNKNLLPTKSLAEQVLIFMQLITMRERYREIEKLNNPELGEIDWCSEKDKYCIEIINDKLGPECYYKIHRTFSFQLEETRDEFLKHYSEDILYCKNLLG